MPTCRVLVVDDDDAIRNILESLLEEDGFTVTKAAREDVALRLAADIPPDVVVLDMLLPGIGGKALARTIKTLSPAVAILAMSASPNALPSPADGDVNAVLTKPFDIDDLLTIVRRLCPPDRPQESVDEFTGATSGPTAS